MKASDAGIRLIQEFEGLATEAYDDVGGKATIGYGHLIKRGETFPKRISEAEATALLCTDLEVAEACIEGLVEVELSQNQFDALCSWVFNLGCTALAGSTLLKLLNKAEYIRAAEQFPRWCKCGQNDVPGLLRRRLAEQLLFNTP